MAVSKGRRWLCWLQHPLKTSTSNSTANSMGRDFPKKSYRLSANQCCRRQQEHRLSSPHEMSLLRKQLLTNEWHCPARCHWSSQSVLGGVRNGERSWTGSWTRAAILRMGSAHLAVGNLDPTKEVGQCFGVAVLRTAPNGSGSTPPLIRCYWCTAWFL